MIQMDASRKTADQPFLRDKSSISPKTVSDGEKTLPRIYKKILSCDTKLESGTESQTRQSCGGKAANTLHYFCAVGRLTIKTDERPVLLSLDGRGFYVLHYSAIPEEKLSRISFDLVDPNTGEGGSAEALVDPKLLEEWNFQKYRVSRFRCDNGDKFNLYAGATKTFTIPRPSNFKGFCENCKTQNPDHAVYCKNCGTKLGS